MNDQTRYVEKGDRDAVAFLLGEAVANRNGHPELACCLARVAKHLADRDHVGADAALPMSETALPTHDECVWGSPVDQRILDKLHHWIANLTAK